MLQFLRTSLCPWIGLTLAIVFAISPCAARANECDSIADSGAGMFEALFAAYTEHADRIVVIDSGTAASNLLRGVDLNGRSVLLEILRRDDSISQLGGPDLPGVKAEVIEAIVAGAGSQPVIGVLYTRGVECVFVNHFQTRGVTQQQDPEIDIGDCWAQACEAHPECCGEMGPFPAICYEFVEACENPGPHPCVAQSATVEECVECCIQGDPADLPACLDACAQSFPPPCQTAQCCLAQTPPPGQGGTIGQCQDCCAGIDDPMEQLSCQLSCIGVYGPPPQVPQLVPGPVNPRPWVPNDCPCGDPPAEGPVSLQYTAWWWCVMIFCWP